MDIGAAGSGSPAGSIASYCHKIYLSLNRSGSSYEKCTLIFSK